jgi:hypothetical protein
MADIPIEQDITVYQGSARNYHVDLKSVPDTFDLNDYTPIGELRERKNYKSTLIATFSGSLDVPNLRVTFTLGSAASKAVTQNGFYEFKLDHNSDDEGDLRLQYGQAILDTGVVDS